ncbi:alpha/beta fold hydrolase [Hoyosella subflava]|uniref:Predicted peptidase (S10/S33 family) n=1 Tax=Hoyosella subflava (strain DSM 45089 / JCM 17490 / NBRC 109087 / DQS3-9A1) TaxID=443218 RepID=F6EPK6_HOYSD|nr:alpha/beta hydrolase [Hoyosella subflava]AEF39439.1 Predicted peptidase (S10/S33 family) [Hoyosella subflava DQS3-9A1]
MPPVAQIDSCHARTPAASAPPAGNRGLAVLIAVTMPVLFGVVSGIFTPRGPVTTGEALTTMALALAIGVIAGAAVRSRWAIVFVPVVFIAALEVTRMPITGPTVDAVRLDTQLGWIAFVTGRGIHGLLAVAPLILGAIFGAAYARRHKRELAAPRRFTQRIGLYSRRTLTALLTLTLIALALGVARPAGTDPIVDADGTALPGSIAELTTVTLDGRELGVMIRGHDVRNPILMFVAGGPGGSELGAMRRHLSALEHDFTVVTLDQRGTGKSYAELDPASTLTFDRGVSDVIDLASYLRERFGTDSIYLVGQSYGSLVGVRAAQQRPDLFTAYIGVGQMVSPAETDQITYLDTLAWARASGNREVIEELTAIGPPPYERMSDYEPVLTHETPDVYPYDHSVNSEGAGQFSENLFVREYTLLEQIHALGAFMDVASILYPQLQEIDLRVDALKLDIPVYLMQGRFEARGRAELAEEWFDMVQAPHKEVLLFDTSGHRPLFEQPEVFHDAMVRIEGQR